MGLAPVPLQARVDVGPLLDVLLVLLVLGLVQPPVDGVQVTIPPDLGSCEPSLERYDPPSVLVDARGRIFVQDEVVAPDEVPLHVQRLVQGREWMPIWVAPDGDLPYGRVLEVLELCARGGARNLTLVLDSSLDASTEHPY